MCIQILVGFPCNFHHFKWPKRKFPDFQPRSLTIPPLKNDGLDSLHHLHLCFLLVVDLYRSVDKHANPMDPISYTGRLKKTYSWQMLIYNKCRQSFRPAGQKVDNCLVDNIFQTQRSTPWGKLPGIRNFLKPIGSMYGISPMYIWDIS